MPRPATFNLVTQNGLVQSFDSGFIQLSDLPPGAFDHQLLSHLNYADSGHTGFAGTGVANEFTAVPQTIRKDAASLQEFLRLDNPDAGGAGGKLTFYQGANEVARVSCLFSSHWLLKLGPFGDFSAVVVRNGTDGATRVSVSTGTDLTASIEAALAAQSGRAGDAAIEARGNSGQTAEVFRVICPLGSLSVVYFGVRQGRVLTTDAATATLDSFTPDANSTYLLEARVLARRTGGLAGTADDGAAYVIRAMLTTKAGTVTLGGLVADFSQEDNAAWAANLSVSGSDVRIRVAGDADNDVTWHSTWFIQKVSA